MDQDNIIKIYARTDNRIQLKMIPGHFVTSQSHITHYLDLTTMKSRCAEAQRIASEYLNCIFRLDNYLQRFLSKQLLLR